MGSGFQAHDAFATASQGAVQDRSEEHLVSSDKVIVAARKMMERAIKDVQAWQGTAARHSQSQPTTAFRISGDFRNGARWRK